VGHDGDGLTGVGLGQLLEDGQAAGREGLERPAAARAEARLALSSAADVVGKALLDLGMTQALQHADVGAFEHDAPACTLRTPRPASVH
jgi:hypothetical protein